MQKGDTVRKRLPATPDACCLSALRSLGQELIPYRGGIALLLGVRLPAFLGMTVSLGGTI